MGEGAHGLRQPHAAVPATGGRASGPDARGPVEMGQAVPAEHHGEPRRLSGVPYQWVFEK